MTEKLKNLLHERAAQPDFALPDVDALVQNGDRLVRRRRTAMVGGLAALAVVGSLGVAQLLGGATPSSAPVPVTDAPPSAGLLPVTWATGSVIHVGNESIDVGVEVTSYVVTSVGYVFTDPAGVVHGVVDGEVSDLGRVDPDRPHLVADDDDPRAGWLDPTGSRAVFVVHDLVSGETIRNDDATDGLDPEPHENSAGYFYAIDDATAYWRDTRGVVAVDLASGDAEVLEIEGRGQIEVKDAASGQVVFSQGNRTFVGPSPGAAVDLHQSWGDVGALSPDGRWYTQDADEPTVFDTATGEKARFDLADYGFATGYAWLDNDTVVMIAAKDPESSSAELLACQVPAGSCRVAQGDLGSFDELTGGNFQLPVGETITGD